MKVSEVSAQDCQMLAKLITIIQVGEYTVSGKDICAAADSIRWMQDIGKDMAKGFAETKASDKPAGVEPPSAPAAPSVPSAAPEMPLPGLGDVKIKAYNPGKVGKSK